MKSLYSRIVLFSVFIVCISFILGLFISNIVYNRGIKAEYEQKMEVVGSSIEGLSPMVDQKDELLEPFLTHVSGLGYQIYLVDDSGNGHMFGRAFKTMDLQPEQVEAVLSGQRYKGLASQPSSWLVPTLFENRLSMSEGFPFVWNGTTYALFVRPDMVQQLNEVRIMLAVLFTATFLISLVLIAIKTRYIVRPLKRLTIATDNLEKGQYEVCLDTSRGDEIGELARRFTRMTHTLKQVDKMRKQFVANVSHEIQSPLTTIHGLAEQLRDRPLPPEQEKKYLHIIAEESDRLSALSRQLLTLAALERGTETLKRNSFRVDEQLREVLIRMETEWSAKEIELDIELSESVIEGDAGLLYQVWNNLIGNAIKFTASGGRIHVSCKRIEFGGVTVKIADNGPGIPEDDIPFIFDRFYKSDSGAGRNPNGTGLGLSIAKRIVELHEGDIHVNSSVGKGTEFTVKLP
ncbi:sensor histidine kinase [Paenibacillus marinisediminis]